MESINCIGKYRVHPGCGQQKLYFFFLSLAKRNSGHCSSSFRISGDKAERAVIQLFDVGKHICPVNTDLFPCKRDFFRGNLSLRVSLPG